MDPGTGAAAKKYKKMPMCISFGFVGSGFYGLQSQPKRPDLPTVARTLRQALLESGAIAASNMEPLSRTKWSLSSRTDKGVHAIGAAASFRMETLPEQLEEQDGRLALRAAEVARINGFLPPEVRVFGAARVRGGFDARLCASSREYEYLLPLSALGGASEAEARARVLEFDRVLSSFQGSHRFHNFGSGLRTAVSDMEVYEAGGESWPLGLASGDGDKKGSVAKAFRAVLKSRVERTLTVCGEPYVLVRISGVSFVLHQIRHMIGTALAVTHGVLPPDAAELALATSLHVCASPLAPGCGLLLNRIFWYDIGTATEETAYAPWQLADMEAFKREAVYPHIHGLYQGEGSELARFLQMINEPTSELHYHYSPLMRPDGKTGTIAEAPEDYALLRRMTKRWLEERAAKAEARRLARLRVWEDDEPSEKGRAEATAGVTAGGTAEAGAEGLATAEATGEEVSESTRQAKDGGARGDGSDGDDDDDDDDDERHGASVIDEAFKRRRGVHKKRDQPMLDRRSRSGLPGGLHVRICVHRELVPGPELREMLDRLQAEVRQGLLETQRPHEYYLARLDELYGAVAPSEVRWEAES